MGKLIPTAVSKRCAAENQIINKAIGILEKRLHDIPDVMMTNPSVVKNYLRLQLEGEEQEIFMVIFLDNRHRLIVCKKLFFGTIDGCSVYPREVVKKALANNAAAIILAHNHPSGMAEPSQSDIRITEKIRSALSILDIRVLDHFIVGHREIVSFAERGLI